MPAYSYKPRFVPFVKEKSKRQTVRAFRKYPTKVGQTAYHYSGLRTKHTVKLGEDPITNVQVVAIYPDGKLFLLETNWLSKQEEEKVKENIRNTPEGVKFHLLGGPSKDVFAWNDGFRHENKPLSNDGCFELMFRWFKSTHELPFIGTVTYW